jgi:UPF0716 family protein affecting phage T7 exclusion
MVKNILNIEVTQIQLQFIFGGLMLWLIIAVNERIGIGALLWVVIVFLYFGLANLKEKAKRTKQKNTNILKGCKLK